MDETLGSVLDESGDEEEGEAIMNQVLDEIGIEIAGKVRTMPHFFHFSPLTKTLLLLFQVAAAPRAHGEALPSERVKAKTRTRTADDDLAEQLARLRDL